MMFRYTFLFLFSLFNFAVYAQTNLEYNLNEGDLFSIMQESVQETSRMLEESNQIINAKVYAVMDFKVQSEIQGTFQIGVTYKELRMTIYSNIEGILLDVDANKIVEGDSQSRIFHSILNMPVVLTIDKKGDVMTVTGGDKLVAKMVEAAGSEDAQTRALMTASLDKEFGSEALATSFEQMTYIYPGRKMEIGDSWDNSYSGQVAINNHWTLAGVTDDEARILGKAQVLVEVREPEASMSLKGNRDTEVTADLSSGFITAMRVTDQSAGSTTIPGLGERSIPTTIQSTTTYKRI